MLENPRARSAKLRAIEKISYESSQELSEIVRAAVPIHYRRGKLHPATLVFQALRIAVNRELEQLQKGLDAAISRLRPQGRLAAISFHSLEDRIVKHTLLGAKERLTILTKKPIGATPEEIRRNPRSRSAKLRAAEKKEEES